MRQEIMIERGSILGMEVYKKRNEAMQRTLTWPELHSS
jgi:hypothetical protein